MYTGVSWLRMANLNNSPGLLLDGQTRIILFLRSMARKKILWLCSWYPDRLQPYNGDFVQRHALAASRFNDIYVLHLVADNITKRTEEKITGDASLTEHIIYYQKTSFLKKITNYWRWNNSYTRAIKRYIESNGLPDLIHVHVPMRDGVIAARLKKKYKLPYIITEHWTIYQPQNEISFEQQPGLFRSLLNYITRNSDLLVPVSRDLGERMNELVCKKEFSVIENAADTDLFFYDPSLVANEKFRFVHVSTMGYQKNTEGLISAFIKFSQSYPDTELLLVGPVPDDIQNILSSSSLLNKNIYTTGEVSYPEVASQLKSCHAFVLFSRFENSPCSIIEALCCGLPVIATKVGGIPELVHDGNGILVEPGNQESLHEAFRQLKENYSGYDRAEISRAAIQKYNYTTIGKKLDDVYEEVLKRQS